MRTSWTTSFQPHNLNLIMDFQKQINEHFNLLNERIKDACEVWNNEAEEREEDDKPLTD